MYLSVVWLNTRLCVNEYYRNWSDYCKTWNKHTRNKTLVCKQQTNSQRQQKNKLMHFASRLCNVISVTSVKMSDYCISHIPSVNDIGVSYYDELILVPHVSNICRSASHMIGQNSQIFKILTLLTNSSMVLP